MNYPTVESEKPKTTNIPFHKVGAVFYGLWGFWHFQVVAGMFEFASTQMKPDILQARIYQGAFHILWFAVGAIAIAILFNWRNSRLGYWANLLMIGWTEVGLLLFLSCLVIFLGYLKGLSAHFYGFSLFCLALLVIVLIPRKHDLKEKDEKEILVRSAI